MFANVVVRPIPCPLLHHLPPILQIFIFIGETLLSMNWAIVADILLVSRWLAHSYPSG